MPATVKDTGSAAFDKFINANESLEGIEAAWGWLDTARDYPDGTSLHMVAAVHTFGISSEEIPNGPTIPKRDVIGGSYDARATEYTTLTDIAYEAVLNGQMPESALKSIAAKGATDMKKDFFSLSFTPLSASTIAKKGHSQALIETRHLLNEVNYAVRRG